MKKILRHLNIKKINRILKSEVAFILVLTIVFSLVLTGQFRTTVNAASSNSQTKYSNVADFQKNRWLSIENSVFGKKWTDLRTAKQIGNGIKNKNLTVQSSASNTYFHWTDTGFQSGAEGNYKKWDGTKGTGYRTSNKKEVTIDYNVNDGTNENLKITFTEFTINNARQFRDVLEYFNNKNVTNKYVKVNLNSDLDMGGQDGVIWDPIETNYCLDNDYKKWLYIEGNGHTIYNLCIYTDDKEKGAGLFSHPPAFMIVKNLGFQSSMVLHGYDDGDSYATSVGLIAGFCPQKGYFYNVHSDGGYFQMSDKINTTGSGGMGGLIGRKDIWASQNTFSERGAFERINTGDFYLENCSTGNYYMYGSDHIGGLTSFMGVNAKTLSRYDRKFPQKPERFIVRDRNYGKYTQDQLSDCIEHIETYNYFPIMVKDCYSVDSTIFSTGHDSGAFISCGRGIIAEGCFTNNTIYATDNTGGFIGRVVNTNLPYIMDARGENGDNTVAKNYTIGSYFKDCYSSGIVEGSNAMGGFVGLDNTKRDLNSIYTDTGANAKDRDSTKNYSSTVYENCYSTAMVGMDYAGKYCGGFVGLDDNYGETGLTVAIKQNGNTVQKKIAVGSAYINCYAAGEVGNILTVTDIDSDTKTRENDYFTNHECKNESDVLDYYPTGGFAGAVGLDLYYYTNKKELTGKNPKAAEKTFSEVGKAGFFYNCYYDMQTTAMHEMAIGLAKQQTCRGTAGDNFNVVGITGLYTVNSDVKLVPGLTGSPKSYAGGKSFKMDDSENNSTIWQYNDGYYPQLTLFMASDITISDITTAKDANITNAIKKSEFFIDVDTDESTRSEPVLSLANSLAEYGNKNKAAAQIAGVITAYRYSQASTSTVFLDHWDYTMDTNSGATEGENDWRPGLEQNRMVKETVTDENGNEVEEWQITYTNVAAGTYEFKVQAGTSWAYNYGRTRFNDTENISLVVPFDKCTVKIRFHYAEIKNNKFYVKADFYDETGEFVRTETLTSAVYQEYEPTPYTVAGSLPEQSWNADKNDLYTMTYMGDERTYSLTIKDLPEGFYQFKITNGGGWGVNYGIDGVPDGNNMEFKLTGTTNVTIIFDEKTKLCEVTAEIPECLTDVHVSDKKIDFSGYSVICSSSQITGYTWLTDGQEKEAAEAGQLFFDSSEGVYTRTFNLPIKNDSGQYINVDENYAYKVIKDAVDDGGPNSGFYISKPLDDSITEIPLVFKYNEKTDEASVSSTLEDVVQPNVRATNYSVVGTEGLTGYNWLGENKGDEYSKNAANAGLMSPVDGSGTLYEKIYNGIQPGTYQFKVVPDTLDGMWKFPLDYGDEDGGNYIITILNSDGTNQFKDVQVRILFDASKGTIDVTTSPAEALQLDRYVISGGTNLMGENRKWSTTDPEMKYDKETGHYIYTLENVRINDTAQVPTVDFLPNISYSYKIVPYGEDKGENKYFILRGPQISYNVKFDYNPKTEETILTAYDEQGNDVSDSVLSYDVKPTFYSVIGDSILTGYDWDTNQSIEAAYYGLMDDTDNDGIYEKTYKINVPSGGAVANYSFKVAANGTFNSGMSWGPDGFGDNHNFVVSVQSNDPSILEAYLTIYFDSKAGEITYKTDPESVSSGIDDSSFIWYVAGTYMLRNNNSFTYDTTVYDTVRDITSGFTFTCGENTDERGLTWSIDTEYNRASDFKDRLSFNISYSQEGTSATGTFETDIIDLEVQPLYESDYEASVGDDHIKILAQYFVDKFMPGKQWLKVTSVGYGYSQSFRDWKVNNLEYNNYVSAKKEYDRYFNRYLAILKGMPYTDSITGYVTEHNLIEYLEKNSETCKDIAARIGLPSGTTLLTLYADINNTEKYPVTTKPQDEYPSVSNQSVAGSRDIRLIPTAYLEAGNDAKISVIQSADDATGEKANNIVRYEGKNSESGTSFALDNNQSINTVPFTYYNVGMTAAFLSTDKVGLGIYNNYDKQAVANYDKSQIRDDNDVKVRNDNKGKGRYFAMSSAFNVMANNTQTGDNADYGADRYSDSYEDGQGNQIGGKPYIKVGSFINQSIIGNSRYASDNEKGQSIVKIFKKATDSNGTEYLDLVYVDSESTNTEYGKNYRLWTGQEKFTAGQAGTYTAVFYWALADGRYITDQKDIIVDVLEPGLTKSVDKEYDTAGSDRELTYTVTYTNDRTDENLNFALLDVLPYSDSTRYHKDINGNEKKATTKDNGSKLSFDIESLSINYSNPSTVIKGIYVSKPGKGEELRTLLNPSYDEDDLDSDGNPKSSKIAGILELATEDDPEENGTIIGQATELFDLIDKNKDEMNGVIDEDTYYNPGERYVTYRDRTAIAITGIELGVGEKITLTYKLKLNSDPGDFLVNDAHFFVQGMENTDVKSVDNCNYVSTAYIDRNVSGYAWMDENVDGILDEDEPRLPGLKVALFDVTGDNAKRVAETTTNDEGFYEFKSLPAGDYVIKCIDEDNKNFSYTFIDSHGNQKTIGFEDLSVSPKKNQYEMEGKVIGSRTLFDSTYKPTQIGNYYQLQEASLSLSMPTNQQVYYGSYSSAVGMNATNTDFNFDKKVQNVAFYYEDFNNGFKINKVTNIDGKEVGVDGVDFMLEYRLSTDVLDENGEVIGSKDEWYPVYYVELTDTENGTSTKRAVFDANNPKTAEQLKDEGIDYIFSTSQGGLIEFENLFSGYFRLTEVSTKNASVPNLGKLASSIEFNLPYAVDVDELNKNNLIQLSEDESDYTLSEDGKTRYYHHIAFKINNTAAQFDLPVTGDNGFFVILLIGVVLLGVGTLIVLLCIKKSRKKAK